MITVKVFNNSKNELPKYESRSAAGLDLKADFSDKTETSDFLGNDGYEYNSDKKELTLYSNGGRVLIPTNLHTKIPDGYEVQVRPRSGLALKNGISVVNAPGTIDSDYLGNWGVILINTDPYKKFVIKDGDRIAQAVLNKVEQIDWINVSTIEELGETERGQGGFGHTGQ